MESTLENIQTNHKAHISSQLPTVIENRPYGPESNLEEIRAIENRISILRDGIILWREIPYPSIFQHSIFQRKLLELEHQIKQYSLLIDIRETRRPDTNIRNNLFKLFNNLKNCHYIAAFTGKNFMLNVATKFTVLNNNVKIESSVHKTYEQALAAIEANEEKVLKENNKGRIKYVRKN